MGLALLQQGVDDRLCDGARARIGGTHFDPRLEVCHLLRTEGSCLALGRHGGFRVVAFDGLKEKTLGSVSRHQSGAGVAPFEDGVAGVQQEAALVLAGFGAVAAVAALGQHGPDFVFEKLGLFGWEFRAKRRRSGEQQRCECESHYVRRE